MTVFQAAKNASRLCYPDAPLWSLRRRRSDPLGFLEALARQGDFVPFSLARRQAFLLNHPEHVSAVLVSHSARFQKGSANHRAKQLLGNGLLTADGALHAERRATIQPAFARKRLENCSPLMVARARTMCERWCDGQVVDVTQSIGALTFGVVGQAVIGAEVEPLFEDVRRAAFDATASVDPLLSLVAPLRQVRVAQQRLRAIVESLVPRVAQGGSDGALLSLLQEGDFGPRTREQLVDDVLTILLAGHDTITSALTWTFLLLASHSIVEENLRAELDSVLGSRDATVDDLPNLVYTRGVLAESLRLYPPAWVLARHAVEAHHFAEGTVPAGTLVLVSQYLLHRDERYFSRPHRFDPDRWRAGQPDRPRLAYFPFGAGPRSCIGEGLAWMEGMLLLATIAQRWRLRSLGSEFPEIEARITLRPRQRVLLRASAI